MWLGYFPISSFDCVVLGLLVCGNVVRWKYRPTQAAGCLVTSFAFGLLLPLLSQQVEFRLHPQPTETFDAFTMAYTYLKFPFYWCVGVCQQVVLFAKRF